MFETMKKPTNMPTTKKKRKLWWLLFLVTKFSVLLSSDYLLVYIDRAKACFVFNWWKIYTLKKLNKSNFRIFFKETQIYLCHQRWQMSLKTIHKSYLLICSLYFNDNINNVVKKRIIRIRFKNYNRKQLTNKFDEKKSRHKWKLGISHS